MRKFTTTLFISFIISFFTNLNAAELVSIDATGGEVLVGNITKWNDCVAKGTQLIDMAHNGSYIDFEAETSVSGLFTFKSDIATSLEGISCVLGYVDANGNYLEADTLAISNTGSWTTTKEYSWLFNLQTGTHYSFRMTCIAGGGYALNAFTLKIVPFGANVLAKEVQANGQVLHSENSNYKSEAYYGQDLSVIVTPVSSTASVSYSAKCGETDLPISHDGLIEKSHFKNGDLISVKALISDGPTAKAEYSIDVQINDLLTAEILGAAQNPGIWTSLSSTNFIKSWTDYIYSLEPEMTSYRFYNSSWTTSSGKQIACVYASKAVATLSIPSYFKLVSIQAVGYGGGSFHFASEGASIIAETDSVFALTSSSTQIDDIKFIVSNHTPGAPLKISVNNSYARFYLILRYQATEDVSAPFLKDQNIRNSDVVASANGYISLRFNEPIRIAAGAQATLNGSNAELVIENDLFLRHYYYGLNYDSFNSFVLKANSIEDISGNKNTEDIAINFSVGSKMPVLKKKYNFIVGIDGTMDQAIAAANAFTGTGRYYIFVPNGNYELQGNDGDHMTSLNRSYVSIIGQSKDSTVISNTPVSYGISNTATIHLNYATHTYMEDLTLKNNRGEAGGGQQVVLYDRGSQNIFKQVKLFSFQDTYVSGDRAYWDHCDIYGSTDYICGGGNVYFDHCFLYNRGASGTKITAPATNPSTKWGYVFQYCTIQGGAYTLGRPWQGEPRSYFLNSTMNRQPDGTGWDGMSGLITHFYEYNSMDESGNPLDLSARGNSPSSINQYVPVLTDEEAKLFNIFNVLGASDGWLPSDLTVQTEAPNVKVSGSTLSWTEDINAMCTVIFKNGQFLACVTDNSYLLTENGTYTIQSANAMGGLGDATVVLVTTTGLTTPVYDYEIPETATIYDTMGRKMQKISQNGIYIIDGIKSRVVVYGGPQY